jgi:hypothetical protein
MFALPCAPGHQTAGRCKGQRDLLSLSDHLDIRYFMAFLVLIWALPKFMQAKET